MTITQARKTLIFLSLASTGVTILFFLLAPALGYPLLFAQSLRIFEILLPVFFSYIGSAAMFAFRTGSDEQDVSFRRGTTDLIPMLIWGPIGIFGIALIAIIIAFGVTNRPSASPGIGMTIDQLTGALSAVLGLLTITTNVAVGFLFPGDRKKDTNNNK